MRWIVHGERLVYDSEWVRLALTDVEQPGGDRFEHHVVRSCAPAVGVVVDDGERVLLLWRHRFITDTWGWEIPAGRVDAGESPAAAAERETLEETGWQPGPLTELASYAPMNGTSDQRFHLFRADGGTRVGEPSDPFESERVEWVRWDEVRHLLGRGAVVDGLTLSGLSWVLAGL